MADLRKVQPRVLSQLLPSFLLAHNLLYLPRARFYPQFRPNSKPDSLQFSVNRLKYEVSGIDSRTAAFLHQISCCTSKSYRGTPHLPRPQLRTTPPSPLPSPANITYKSDSLRTETHIERKYAADFRNRRDEKITKYTKTWARRGWKINFVTVRLPLLSVWA
jgi:hypothetical protein